ncbi:hypothetical protein CJ030_MR0G007670 [Morella rubra]|uniref:Uncharacterized protein n=1 Tax=Morella rubra TaxID=262757 RepID=A0A6A1UJH0_9ROSI|nr:hypothetical protein CJ030_MR0G007670 [Morella rubra]
MKTETHLLSRVDHKPTDSSVGVVCGNARSSRDKRFMVITKSKGKGKTSGNPEPPSEPPPQVIEGLVETVHESHINTGREPNHNNGQPGETFVQGRRAREAHMPQISIPERYDEEVCILVVQQRLALSIWTE